MRRLQFSMRTLMFFVAVCGLACGLACYTPKFIRSWRGHCLAAFDGADLRSLRRSDDSRWYDAISLVGELVPDHGDEFPGFSFQTWYVWREPTSGDLLIFQGKHSIAYRESSFARVFVLTAGGELVTSITIPTGRSIDIVGASFHAESGGRASLVIETDRCNNGWDVRRQFYSYAARSVSLCRLEDSHGDPVSKEALDPVARPAAEPMAR